MVEPAYRCQGLTPASGEALAVIGSQDQSRVGDTSLAGAEEEEEEEEEAGVGGGGVRARVKCCGRSRAVIQWLCSLQCLGPEAFSALPALSWRRAPWISL